MIQSLEVISVNLWNIIISLANLLILYAIIKKFLFKPVKNVMSKRQAEIDERYSSANEAEKAAYESKSEWEARLGRATQEASDILSQATDNAKLRSDKIIDEARNRAETIIRQAESEADLEYKKAADKIKHEIVEVSGDIAEKILGREVNTEDHRNLIDSFIENIGDKSE